MFTYRIDDEISLALPRPDADAAPLFALVDHDREALGRYLPWVPNMDSVEAEAFFLQTTLDHYAKGISLNTVIHYGDAVAGMISFNHLDTLNHQADIGYWLGVEFHGHNIMHRAVSGMCALGFVDFDLNRLIIRAAVDNEPSNHVAQKAGFTLEARLREAELLADGYHDENQYSRLKND